MLLPIIAVDPDGTPERDQEASHQHLRQKPGTPGNSGAEPSRIHPAPVRRTAPDRFGISVRTAPERQGTRSRFRARPALPRTAPLDSEQPVVAHRMGYTTRSDLGAGRFGPYGIVPAA